MNSKSKGSSFERKIAGELSLWLTNNEDNRSVWRSDTSGAAATILHKQGKNDKYVKLNAGDLRAISEKGEYPIVDSFFEKYCVETKHYAKIDLYPPLTQVVKDLFESAHKNAEISGKIPVLIMKANRKDTLFLIGGPMDTSAPLLMTIPYKTYSYDCYELCQIIKSPYQPPTKTT